MDWRPVSSSVPEDEFLAWAGGRCFIACRIEPLDGGPAFYMDVRTDELLPTPTHWMPLPDPPPAP